MISNKDSAIKVAQFLLQIKAVRLQPDQPFSWASGWNSPIYCDNRKTLSYPQIRTFIRQELSKAILDKYGKPNLIAGVATGGIAQGVLVAQELGVGFVYVRPSAKEHGLNNKVEGYFEEGQDVVVIEDLVSTGKSSLQAVDSLRESGCIVKGMVSIFTYGFKAASESFKAAKCELITLTDYDVLIREAVKSKYISEDDLDSLKEWRENPSVWENKLK
ncbi:MAG: orotate phosphoribosyltransferase [Flavobacteriales bacterium]